MANSFAAKIEFSFQGEDYTYASEIDLDRLLRLHDELPSLHVLLANSHGIDTYSYLYEVMQEADIEISDPQGFARHYLTGNDFDLCAFASDWQKNKALLLVQPIALRELEITDLDQHPALKRALIAAYNIGRTA